MRVVLGVALVGLFSSLAYSAGPEEGETPRAEAIKANFAKLVSEDKEVKREALLYFGKVDKTFAAEVPLFTASLKDKRNQVRAISAYALGKIGQAAAGSIPEVEKLLADSSATVQKYAKRALERLKPFKPVPKKVTPEEAPLPQKPRASTPTPDEVVDVITGLGGRLEFDKNKAVVSVDLLLNRRVTDAGLVHLKGLTNLQRLILIATKVTDAGLVHLKGLTNLQKLYLNRTKITDAGLVHLKGLTNLQQLVLTYTKITDAGLVHLKGMTKLEGLYLSGTKVTDAGLVHLKGLTNLEWLSFNETKVTDAGLTHLKGLKKLENLTLTYTKVTDAGLVHLKGLTNLQTLILSGTEVTEAGFKKLRQALPKCVIY